MFSKLHDKVLKEKPNAFVFKLAKYKKCIKAIEKAEKIENYEDVKTALLTEFKNPKETLEHVKEFINTGKLKKLEGYVVNPKNVILKKLKSIPQIGDAKAKELLKLGISSHKNLIKKQNLLTNSQKLGVQFYDNLIDPSTLAQRRIPREEFKKLAKSIPNTFDYTFVGSYRRKLSTSGDIDILFRGSADDFLSFKKHLSLNKSFSDGKSKFMGLIKIDKLYRHIDILHTKDDEYPFALLYFTGSKEFNQYMRNIAKKKGFTLNEKGLFKDKIKVSTVFKTEEDVFKFLDIPYREPEHRNSVPIASIKHFHKPNSFNVSKGVLLASVYDNSIDPTGYFASEKFDGVRAIWTGSKLVSRTNKPINAPQWFLNDFPKGIALDGELYIKRCAFQETTSIVLKKVPIDDEWKCIKFVSFDIPSDSSIFKARFENLKKLIKKLKSKHITLAEHTEIKSKEHMRKMYKNIVEKNGEGLMLRKPNSIYVQKRSKNLLKVKPTDDSEAIITDMIEGKGKDKGRMGALVVKLYKDPKITFKIGTGFDDKQRQNMWDSRKDMIGTIVSFGFKGLTDSGKPRHPAFIRIRKDINI